MMLSVWLVAATLAQAGEQAGPKGELPGSRVETVSLSVAPIAAPPTLPAAEGLIDARTSAASPAPARASAPSAEASPAAAAADSEVRALADGLAQDLSAPGSEGASGAAAAKDRLDARFTGSRPSGGTDVDVLAQEDQASSSKLLAPLRRHAATSRRAAKVPALLQKIMGGDGVPAGLAAMGFGWFFLTTLAYAIIGPVRTAYASVSAGPEMMPEIFMACAVVAGVVAAAYSALSKRVSRKTLLSGTLAFLSASLAAWWGVIQLVPMTPWLSGGLFVWSDLFAIMAGMVFWTYANEIFHSHQARKAYGFITAGGEIGSMIGSALTTLVVAKVGVANMLLVAAGGFAATLGFFVLMERWRGPAAEEPPAQEPVAHDGGVLSLFSSRLVFLLGLIVFLERLVPDFSFYIYSFVMHDAFPDKTVLAQMAAEFTFWQNCVSFGASLAFAAYVLPRIGVAGALMSAALANAAGLAVVGAGGAALATVAGYNALEGLLRYTWFKSAKEMVYTTVDRSVLYRLKAFIELFIYKSARGLAGLMLLGVGLAAPHLAGPAATPADVARASISLAALVGVPFAAAWVWAAWSLGKAFKAAERKQ